MCARRIRISILGTPGAGLLPPVVRPAPDRLIKRYFHDMRQLRMFNDHDGVPWNNNNAEHAVKQFAYYREVADGAFSEHGLNEYLVLLAWT